MKFDPNKIKPGWSHSKLETYRDCPLRFARKYIERREEPTGDLAIIGRIVSACMAEFRIRWIEGGDDVRLSGHLDRLAKREFLAVPDELMAKAIETLYGAVNHMHDLKPQTSRIKQYWIEERLAFDNKWQRIKFSKADAKWWGSAAQREKTWFRMAADFAWLDVDGGLHIEDDKSLGFKDRDTQQIASYAYCMAGMLGIDKDAPISCAYNLFGAKRQQPFITTMEEQREFPDWLQNSVDEIMSTTNFEPRQGKACDWCGFVDECPRHQKVAGELQTVESFGALDTPEKRVAAALWLDAAERCVGQARNHLKAATKEHGPITLGTGKVLVLNGNSRKSMPADLFIGLLIGAGINGAEALKHIGLTTNDADDVMRKLYPLAGSGVTKEVKEVNAQLRGEALSALDPFWEERHLASTLAFRSEDAG